MRITREKKQLQLGKSTDPTAARTSRVNLSSAVGNFLSATEGNYTNFFLHSLFPGFIAIYVYNVYIYLHTICPVFFP